MTIHDITLAVAGSSPVWPGDSPVEVQRVSEDGEPVVSRLSMSSHSGTHVDAPLHFVPGGKTIDQLSLSVLVGAAWVVNVGAVDKVTAEVLASVGVPAGVTRLLIRTRNSERARTSFDSDYVALTSDAADWVLSRGIRLIGIDGPSVEPYVSPGNPVHRALLGAGLIIVENLALADIRPDGYRLVCLPLPIANGDGAPARVILIEES
jgi:arylformamidase